MEKLTVEQMLSAAIGHHRAGRLAEAEGAYRRILGIDPSNARALHGLGMIACEAGHVPAGVELLRRAVAADPGVADYHNHLGQALGQQGLFEEAEKECRLAIQRRPVFADAYTNLGDALRGMGKLEEARAAYETAIGQEKDHAVAHNNLGITLREQGQLTQAEAVFGRLVGFAPDLVEGHNNFGTVLAALKKNAQAEGEFRKAIALDEGYVEAHVSLAELLADGRQTEEAIKHARRALELKPPAALLNQLGVLLAKLGQMERAYDAASEAARMLPSRPDILCNLANILRELGRLDEAEAQCRKAIELDPGIAEAHCNLGHVLLKKKRGTEAEAALRESIRIRPGYVEAMSGLALVLSRIGQSDEAVQVLQRAIEIDPGSAPLHKNLGNVFLDRGQTDEAIDEYRKAYETERVDEPHGSNLLYAMHVHPAYDAAAILLEHKRWAQRYPDSLSRNLLAHRNDRSRERRLRIGYVSPDFHAHPVGRFLVPLFAHHDHRKFEIICYSDCVANDYVTEQIRAGADSWHDIVGKSDEQVAELIRSHEIDILVDLTLHMAGSRLFVFARRPAPVQVTYLAYPGTSGLSAMDWRLTDRYLDPPGSDAHYTERSMRLASYWCYRPPREAPEVGALPAAKNGFVTFGCLNSFHKVSRPCLESWAALLGRVPDSRIMIHAKPGNHLGQVERLFSDRGIQRERVEFVAMRPMREYMDLYNRIDIGLDPFPYNGGTSTCDALWMGVPVVSLSGDVGVRRSGSSLLNQVGLTDSVAGSVDQYIRLAIKLAEDLRQLEQLRGTLRQRMISSHLMDEAGFTREMEHAFSAMWANYCGS